jgi:hypothetical protein
MFSLGGALWPLGTTALLGALEVEAETPGALCPPLPTAIATLSERLGTLEDDYTLRYSVLRNVAKGETALQLVMTNVEGRVVLERRVPLGPEGCETAAQVMAHVVETFLAEESPKGDNPPANSESEGPPVPEPAPKNPAENPREREPSETSPPSNASQAPLAPLPPPTAAAAREPDPRANPRAPRFVLGVGPALSFEAALDVLVSARVPSPWRATEDWSLYLGAAIPLYAQHTRDARLGAEVGSTNPLFFLEVAYRWLLSDTVHLFVGAGALTVVQTAWINAETGVSASPGQTRVLFAPSLGASLSFLLGKNLELSAGAFGGPTLTGLASPYIFTLDSSQRDEPEVEVLPPSAVSGFAAATVGWRF